TATLSSARLLWSASGRDANEMVDCPWQQIGRSDPSVALSTPGIARTFASSWSSVTRARSTPGYLPGDRRTMAASTCDGWKPGSTAVSLAKLRTSRPDPASSTTANDTQAQDRAARVSFRRGPQHCHSQYALHAD